MKAIALNTELGADQVIAYDKENIHRHNGKYDLVIDTHGNLDHKDFKRLGQRGVITGFTMMGQWFLIQLKSAFRDFPWQCLQPKPIPRIWRHWRL